MKRHAILLAALSAAVIFMAACAKNEREKVPAAAVYPVKIETVDGFRTLTNPAYPKEGVVRYALQDDLTIGGEGGGAESVLNRPIDLRVDAQGNIYALDWGDVDFKVFSPDGRLLRKFGKKGQGPGDFDIPAYFDLAADGRIFLLSGRQYQISLLDSAGTYLSSFKVDGFCYGLAVDGRNRIYYTQMLMLDPGGSEEFQLMQNRKALFRSDEFGRDKIRLGEYLDVTRLRKVQKVGETMTSTSFTSRESYTTSWLVGPDDRVYIGYNKDYRLDVYDPDWKLLFRFGREFTPIPHPEYKPGAPHPEFYPAFSDWRKFFDGEGNLWLEQYVAEGVKDHVFDVFSPEGIYLKQVRVPQALYLVRGDAGLQHHPPGRRIPRRQEIPDAARADRRQGMKPRRSLRAAWLLFAIFLAIAASCRQSPRSFSGHELAVLEASEAVVQLFKRNPGAVWPGYDLSRHPFIVYIPEKWALLFNPPGGKAIEGFSAPPPGWPDLGVPMLYHEGQYQDLVGQLAFDFPLADIRLAAVGIPEGLTKGQAFPDSGLMEFIIHENFHEFQDKKFGDIPWEREERYPILNAENTALSYIETALLKDVLEPVYARDRAKTEELARLFTAVRKERWEKGPPFVMRYEQGQEIREGTAQYVQMKCVDLLKDLDYRSSVSSRNVRDVLKGFSPSRSGSRILRQGSGGIRSNRTT